MHKHIRQLKGTLMKKDLPLFDFVMDNGYMTKKKIICDKWEEYPFEFSVFRKVNGTILNRFIGHRMTPTSRYRYEEDMEEQGIQTDYWDKLLKYSNALCCSDCYWIRYLDGPKTWSDVLKSAGFSIE